MFGREPLKPDSLDPDSALVLLSGGQDSATTLAWALVKYRTVRAISFDYGQRHRAELRSAAKMCGAAGLTHLQVKCEDLLHSTSPLTDPETPLEEYNSYEEMEAIIADRIEKTFVPGRNLFFLALALNRAISFRAGTIVTGVCGMDAANYPDCRYSFVRAVQEAFDEAVAPSRVNIIAPLITLSKAQTVALAFSLPRGREFLSYSHTCYAGKTPPCGRCHACVLRAHGFAQAGENDPLLEAHA